MKKLVLLSMLGMLWMGCTKQESTVKPEETTDADNFILVSIAGQGTVGTRAEPGAGEEYDDKDNGTYKNGTALESYVENVLFLFFDENGEPSNVIKKEKNNYVNYFLWEKVDDNDTSLPDNITGNGNSSETVEKQLNKIIKLTIPRSNNNKGEDPKQIVTIVNPLEKTLESWKNKNLATLQKEYHDFESNITYDKEKNSYSGKFSMSTSVYAENNKCVNTTILNENNFATDATDFDDASKGKEKVIIYVERVLARIDLKIGLKESSGTTLEYPIYTTGKTTGSNSDEDVYVKFLGWNVFDTPDQSHLIKNINPEWTDQEIFGNNYLNYGPWNAYQYHRSFWAINPPEKKDGDTSGISYKKGSFTFTFSNSGNSIEANDNTFPEWVADCHPIPHNDQYTTAYFQENAAPNNDSKTGPKTPSKVILAAQLVNKNGQPLELAKWAGTMWDSWNNLKTYFCNELLELYYLLPSQKEDNDDRGNTTYHYSPIEPKDLHYQKGENNSVNVVLLNEQNAPDGIDASNIGKNRPGGWYLIDNEKNVQEFTETEVNEYIDGKIKSVKVWQNGYTYFYFPIRHFGADGSSAQYGVVRNHIYEATVTKLSGFGTPVSSPKDIVDIEPDTEDESILSAQVKILSWRVVRNNYELTW